MPQDKVIANKLPQHIDMEISARGFNLLIYKLRNNTSEINIDLSEAKPLSIKNHYYLLTNYRLDNVKTQISNSLRIERIIPDTIFLNYNKKVSKRVPIKANFKFEFDNQFQLVDSVSVFPKTVEISGAADIIDKITELETEQLILKGLNKPQTVDVKFLMSSNLELLEIKPSKVQLKINVQKYTEASIDLPIEVENLPAGYALRTFPDKVQVKYNVAFNDYDKINTTLFKAVIDYNKIDPASSHVKVVLAKFPGMVRALKINPEKVEYIIKK
jgi:YbbR domain-containing protein